MALVTLGTNNTTTLQALAWNPQSPVADIASIAAGIKGQNAVQPISPGAFSQPGRLHFPGRRGFVNLLPGDYVAFDLQGWPIIVSAWSIANSGGWTHS